jgi:hypothetical protein
MRIAWTFIFRADPARVICSAQELPMRFGTIAASVMALAFLLAMCALLALLVAAVGFLAVLIAGLVVLVITYTVELEDGSAIGHPRTPELFAMQQQSLEPPKSPEEWAARRAERGERLTILNITKWVGAAFVAIGALGFYFVQL